MPLAPMPPNGSSSAVKCIAMSFTVTPPEIVRRLNVEMVKIINMPDVRDKLIGLGAEPVANTPEAFSALVKTEVVKWAGVVKQSGARVD